jgi:hypothetical protein
LDLIAGALPEGEVVVERGEVEGEERRDYDGALFDARYCEGEQ